MISFRRGSRLYCKRLFCCTSFPVVKRTIMENLKCQMCPSFYTLTIAVMLSHLISVHGSEPNFSVTCEVPGCQRTFRKPRSYQSHLRRLHSDFNLHPSVRVWNEIDSGKKNAGRRRDYDGHYGRRNCK